MLAANLEMTCPGSPRDWAAVGRTATTRSVLQSSTAAALLGSLLGRPPPRNAGLGIPKLGGFPQVCAGCAACGCFWLNDSEEVRLDKHAMDVDTAETLAGVVGLLRRAALALGLPRIAQGLDRLDSSSLSVSTGQPTLVPDIIDIDAPVPACGEPAGLLMSAEQVWAVSWPAWTPTISISSLPSWGMPAAAGRPVIPEMTPQGSGCDD